MHQILLILLLNGGVKRRALISKVQLQHISLTGCIQFWLHISCVWICPDTDPSLLSDLHWHLVSPFPHPSVSHLTRQQEIVSNVCWLSVIICIEVKFGHHVLFNLVGNPWFHSCAGSSGRRKMLGEQGKDIGRGQPNAAGRREEYLKCFRSPVIRVCVCVCVCVICSQEISFLKMRILGMVLYAPPPLQPWKRFFRFLGFCASMFLSFQLSNFLEWRRGWRAGGGALCPSPLQLWERYDIF